ncbi:hypothetical protein [Polyangium sp. 15x6]|uniref:hypothetical protein n=1 Tax=Polyangium sp. 15x6 TaxID=3042687 RepID=UPI00249CE429|nr:hypothetical protein [Polyangium sp. 15x6]MDI3285760.1 hypothetical protein [Polyangium sp. 15x6]
MSRPRLLSALLATAFVASALVQAASCALDTEGSKPTQTTKPCESAANCDDGSSCTVDTCSDEKICVHTPVADGPNPAQTVGDCQRIDCAAGQEVTVTDDADIPDDNEPCTNDACQGGVPSNTDTPDGGVCQRGNESGTCQDGVCQISCDAQNPCDDGNACTDDFCNFATSTCVFTNLDGLPTPGATQKPGDCKQKLCVNGKDTDVTDDTDVPVDVNPCTENVCTNGMPSNPNTTSGTFCEPGKPEVCDGNGACVECTLAEHCVGIVETDCTKRSCIENKCIPNYLGNETTAGAASQTPNDCKLSVCNGIDGSIVAINDDNDKPNDNNPCTVDACLNGMPAYTNAAANTSCGGMNVCNATGQCVGCNSPTQCPGTDDFCKTRTCDNNVCGFSYKNDGTVTPDGQTAMDCKVQVCDGAGNFVIRPDVADIGDDGNPCTKNQCTAQGNPSYPNESLGFTCNVNGGDVCNGNGQCKKSNGKNCAANGDCAGNICADAICCNSSCTNTCQACNVAGNLGTCANVPSGMDDSPTCTGSNTCNGTGQCKKEDGQSCNNNGECLSGSCVDGICCENSCTGTCKSCNVAGNLGKCVNTPSGQPDTVASTKCENGSVCDGAGTCKKATGQTCGNGGECLTTFCNDGRCCDVNCNASTCKACNLAGSEGTCTNIPLGQDDNQANTTCTGTNSCDGMGACKKDNGQTCGNAGDCVSATCADGYCCNSTCTNTCQACNVSGKLGTCSNVEDGQDDTNGAMMCSGAAVSCDGNGNCKKELGQSCGMASECRSGFCNDGVCCSEACTDTCKVCNNSGACVNVASGSDDNNATMTCSGATQSCDNGVCKKSLGQACMMGSNCLSGNCVDGVCCDTACTGTCQACNLTAGTCDTVPQNQTDDTCMDTMACGMSGACKKAPGEDCNSNNECASNDCSGNPKKCQMP